MVAGFNNLVTALVIAFFLIFLGLLTEIVYVLLRRRKQFHHQGDSMLPVQSNDSVYLSCWRKQSRRIEPNEVPVQVCHEESEIDEDLKWQELLCGPSRFLFTIKEEEREGIESLQSDCSSLMADEAPMHLASLDHQCKLGSSITIQIDDDDNPTPFGTPCGSPPYYTPSPSPIRESQSCQADCSFPTNED